MTRLQRKRSDMLGRSRITHLLLLGLGVFGACDAEERLTDAPLDAGNAGEAWAGESSGGTGNGGRLGEGVAGEGGAAGTTTLELAGGASAVGTAGAGGSEPGEEGVAGTPLDVAGAAGTPSGPVCKPIDAGLMEHSCLHTVHGPFETRAAHPLDQTPFNDVDAPHTAFTIVLPELEASTDEHRGAIRYRPTVDGYYAFFLDSLGVPLEIFEADGTLVPRFGTQDVTSSECRLIDGAHVYRLSRRASVSASYRLVLGPSPSAQPVLIIEFIGEEAACSE